MLSSCTSNAAPDESRERALTDLISGLQQQGMDPTVRPPSLDDEVKDEVKIVAEIKQQLFDALCQALEAWGRQHRGRDASPKAPRLLTRPTDVTFTVTLLLQAPKKLAATS